MSQTFTHDPQAVLDYTVDLASKTNGTCVAADPSCVDWLAAGEKISTATWTVPSGLTKENESIASSNTAAKVWISGGSVGVTYTLKVHVVTNASPVRKQDFEIYLVVENRISDWTYSGDPGLSSLDEVRFLVGDTDVNDKKVTDSEIRYAIKKRGDAATAAATLARAIAAKFANLVDKAVGDLSIQYSQRQKQYLDLAERLEEAIGGGFGTWGLPYAGGISRSDVERVEDDDDRVLPHFKRNQFDNLSQEELESDCRRS